VTHIIFIRLIKTKMKTLQTILLAIICLGTAQSVQSQTSTNDLTMTAEAQLLMDTNNPRVFIVVHLLNTTDHEITVLTKSLNYQLELDGNPMVISLGYGNPALTYEGHPIIPSLYDLSPVTLRPNEEAYFSQEVHSPDPIAPETRFVVRYAITPEWAKRFALWSGTIESKPITPHVRKPQ